MGGIAGLRWYISADIFLFMLSIVHKHYEHPNRRKASAKFPRTLKPSEVIHIMITRTLKPSEVIHIMIKNQEAPIIVKDFDIEVEVEVEPPDKSE